MRGRVIQIGRYPVKSMQGEAPARVEVGPSGVVGDRVHAVVDVGSGKIASAKDPRAWAELFALRATYVAEPGVGEPFELTLPDGRRIRSDAASAEDELSQVFGRPVVLRPASHDAMPLYDLVWENTDIAPESAISGAQTGVTDTGDPVSTVPAAFQAPGTFQDVAPITLLTTAALASMKAVHPAGDWDVARFRPNFVIELDDEELDAAADGVPENEWGGVRLAVGTTVLEVTVPSPRCVMTTLAQPGLPRDRDILKTIARANRVEVSSWGGRWACLGAYASVVEPGIVSVGDEVRALGH
jgi:uncharacterized protein YcbX